MGFGSAGFCRSRMRMLAVCTQMMGSVERSSSSSFKGQMFSSTCSVVRIGNRSPEWWWLKDKEGKSP